MNYRLATKTLCGGKDSFGRQNFAEGERVCSSVGGGFAGEPWDNLGKQAEPPDGSGYDVLCKRQQEGVKGAFKCMGDGPELPEHEPILGALKRLQDEGGNLPEPAFFYHSDHLGSAAYLTDDDGRVTQTLNYLPYGEDWADVRNSLPSMLGRHTFSLPLKV